MKRYLILCVIPVFLGFKSRQDIDERKMNRDLEIAKNILATLIKGNSSSFIGGESIDASYIKDYGVVFSIPEHLVYFHSGVSPVIAIPEAPMPDFDFKFEPDFEIHYDEDYEMSEEDKVRLEIEKEKLKEQKELIKEEQKRIKAEIKAVEKERAKALAKASAVREVYVGDGQTSNIDWREIMVTFMTDYADLIGQLKPNERVVINQKSPFEELVVVWAGVGEEQKPEHKGISAEVLRKDITAFKSGKISEKEYVERITIKESKGSKKVADLEMFASIFDRYYSHDLTETYYSQGKPRYELLDGYGAIFHIRASTGRGSYARVRYYRQGESWTVEPDEEKADDATLYPKFKQGLKEFMLDYGRTIRSLGDKEKVMLNIKLSGCRDCELPKSLEVSADISLLNQYDDQKISREKAMEQIGIKETF